jgi:hypothetical protein
MAQFETTWEFGARVNLDGDDRRPGGSSTVGISSKDPDHA